MNELSKLEVALIGVFAGFFLTWVKDYLNRRRERKEELAFLSIQVNNLIEKFIAGSLEVVFDDGTFQGQRDEHGYRTPQVNPPEFVPLSIDVNWKTLPKKLMYRIFDFPTEINEANLLLRSIGEYRYDPPDFDEYFDVRIEQYAKLGLAAIDIAAQIRKLGKLPARPLAEDSKSPTELFENALLKTRKRIEIRESTYR